MDDVFEGFPVSGLHNWAVKLPMRLAVSGCVIRVYVLASSRQAEYEKGILRT